MENKNIDGQLSFDSDFEINNSNDNKSPEVPVVEFQIGTPKKEENLVFEVAKEEIKKAEEANITEPIEEELVIGTPPVAKVSEDTVAKSSAEEQGQSEPLPRRSVYIPRFTEASEKYRKTVDSRARAAMHELRKSSKTEIAEATDDAYDAIADDFSATAEIDIAPASQVVVNVTKSEPEPEKFNVFKFRDDEVREEVKPEPSAEPTLEEEIEEIERLIAKDEPETEIIEADSEQNEAEITALEEESTDVTVPEDYELPDPDGSVKIQEYTDGEVKPVPKEVPDFVLPEAPQDVKSKRSEFTHQSQRDSFKDMFLDSGVAHKIRMGMIAAFSVILLVFEIISAFGDFSPRIFPTSRFFGAMATVDLLLVGCVFLLSIPETVKAIKRLCEKKFSYELALPLGFVVILLYYIVLIAISARKYELYGFVFSLYALVAVYASYYRNLADFTAFKQMSKNSEKKMLDIKKTRDLPEENVALDGLVDVVNSKTARIFRIAFVGDFFERTSKVLDKKKSVLTLFALSLGAALVSAVIALFIPGGVVSAVSAFTVVFLVSCPAFIMLSGKLTYFDAQLAALDEESTVIGEAAYHDFSDIDVIAFDDTEIFGIEDVNLKRFILYGDRDNIERAMRQMYSLFSVAGGPLNKIFAKALDNRVRHTPATDVKIETDGVSGDVSGNIILAGTEAYMKRHGIAVPDAASTPLFGADTTKVMYAAENGEVYAKFFIRYSFSEEFTMLLPSLREQNIVPLIYTNDPNLSNELLHTLSAGADCMRVVKKLEVRPESEEIYRRVSTGLVTYGDKINAINTILLTRKYRIFEDKIAVSALYSLSIAAAVALILTTLGIALPSFVFGLWHIAWCIALRYVSRKTFTEDKKDNK